MTNLEASKIIEDGLDDLSLDYIDNEQYDALQVAIKVLKEDPCEDCITRIEWLKKVTITDGITFEAGINQILNMPPVTPQLKTGHWIIVDDCEDFIAKCSECGRVEDSRMISKYPYCHCGAKMEVEQNG